MTWDEVETLADEAERKDDFVHFPKGTTIYYNIFNADESPTDRCLYVGVSVAPGGLSDRWEIYAGIEELFNNSSLTKKYAIEEASESIVEVFTHYLDTVSYEEVKKDFENCELNLVEDTSY